MDWFVCKNTRFYSRPEKLPTWTHKKEAVGPFLSGKTKIKQYNKQCLTLYVNIILFSMTGSYNNMFNVFITIKMSIKCLI